MEFITKKFIFKSESNYDINMSILKETEDYLKLKIHISFGNKEMPNPTTISWQIPSCDIFSQWSPDKKFQRNLQVDWAPNRTTSRSASWMPVVTHLSLSGQNKITVALSDVLTPMEILSGIIEETAEIEFKLTLFTQRISAIHEYETEIIIDTRDLPFYDCIKDIQKYWASLGHKCAAFPDEALRPIYSSWYAYHQNIDRKTLVEELKLAKEYGMKSVIVDDGWQTNDNRRGYAYCGDWEPIKIPDMKELVEDVHSLGMKYIMWYSVPFVGKYTKAWSRFEGKFLNSYNENYPWCCLDPRYPDVRNYLVSLYETAAKDWKLDGFKLDFIDSFTLTDASSAPNDEMDYESLEEAVCALLREVKERLTRINPNIMIEFRQSYAGPIMCSFGNMIRVEDCPGDPLRNRVDSIHLRMTSGSSPVHSDMILWNNNDKVEAAALEIINIMFAVPQISVLIEKLPDNHKKMLKFYLKLWNEYRDCLMFGDLVAKNPEANYSLVYSHLNDTIFAVSFSTNILEINKGYDEIVFVNGSWNEDLLIKNTDKDYNALVTVSDCMGNLMTEKDWLITNGYNTFEVPASGVLKITKKV